MNLQKFGYCECCKSETKFLAEKEDLREYYLCVKCGCVPRERALMRVLNDHFDDISSIIIHESSPSERGGSILLKAECKNYVSSHYWEDPNYREAPHLNVNLEAQSLASNSFDLVVLQDVFEHLVNPWNAAKEICRTLKNGGYIIQTVPLINGFSPTQQWAKKNDSGSIEWIYEPDYHGNPIDPEGSPVFWHFGYDLASKIDNWANFNSIIISNQLPDYGIEGRLCEVIVSRKITKDE